MYSTLNYKTPQNNHIFCIISVFLRVDHLYYIIKIPNYLMKVFSYFNMWYISSILFRFLLNFSHKLYTIFRFCTNDSLCSPFLPQCHPCDCCLFHRPSFFDLPFHVYLRHIDCQHHSVAGIAPKPLQSTVTVTLD